MLNKSLLSIVASLLVFACSKGSGLSEKKPLYWVAPMDSNYRRDEPGLSPMGMDLVPVYEEPALNSGVGVVSIAPELQNQLGVRSVRVESDILKQNIRSYGRVVFDRTLVSKLSPRVSGWVDMLFVATEGEMVKRGQPLYSLYSPELVKAQEVFIAALKRGIQKNILEAETTLYGLNLDNLTIDRLKREGVAQQSVVFRSPKDGVIGLLKIAEDHFVEPGDSMMAVGSLEDVWVELDVFESQAGLISPQQIIRFTVSAYPGKIWQAEVDYIYPAINARSKSLRFRAKVENPKMLLKPNMIVKALVELPTREAAALIPRQSLISLGQRNKVVLNLGEGRFKSVEVVVGETNGDQVEILEGLKEGDWIVNSAHFLIDSESSKTSDFKRMLSLDDSSVKYTPTWVLAIVKNVDVQGQVLGLNHEYIDAWKMPSMTMNFKVAEGVSIQRLNEGDQIRVKVADGDPLFRVMEIQRLVQDEHK